MCRHAPNSVLIAFLKSQTAVKHRHKHTSKHRTWSSFHVPRLSRKNWHKPCVLIHKSHTELVISMHVHTSGKPTQLIGRNSGARPGRSRPRPVILFRITVLGTVTARDTRLTRFLPPLRPSRDPLRPSRHARDVHDLRASREIGITVKGGRYDGSNDEFPDRVQHSPHRGR